MAKAELKTKENEASVDEFLNSIADEQMRTDGLRIVVVPLRATTVPDGRLTNSWCTLVVIPNRLA